MQCINRGYLGKQTSREKREDKKKQYRVLICILYIMHSGHYILATYGVGSVAWGMHTGMAGYGSYAYSACSQYQYDKDEMFCTFKIK